MLHSGMCRADLTILACPEQINTSRRPSTSHNTALFAGSYPAASPSCDSAPTAWANEAFIRWRTPPAWATKIPPHSTSLSHDALRTFTDTPFQRAVKGGSAVPLRNDIRQAKTCPDPVATAWL